MQRPFWRTGSLAKRFPRMSRTPNRSRPTMARPLSAPRSKARTEHSRIPAFEDKPLTAFRELVS